MGIPITPDYGWSAGVPGDLLRWWFPVNRETFVQHLEQIVETDYRTKDPENHVEPHRDVPQLELADRPTRHTNPTTQLLLCEPVGFASIADDLPDHRPEKSALREKLRGRWLTPAASPVRRHHHTVLPRRTVTGMGDGVAGWLPVGLEPVVLRLARADQLTYELAKTAFGWSSGEPLGLEQVWICPHRIEVRVQTVREVPPVLPMLFSEPINHLRAAIDNAVFHLAQEAHGRPFTAKEAAAVAMPIHGTEDGYSKWVDRTRGRLPVMTDGTLADRIRGLQPFNDTHSRIGSTRELLATLQGITPVYEHPLLLLQGYSNHDKHRQIRIAAVRNVYQREDLPFHDTDRTLRPLAAGDVLDTITYGVPAPATTQPGIVVERPDGSAVVSPARELGLLADYVSTVLLPTLTIGMAITDPIPPNIDLSDNGQTTRERIRNGQPEPGHQRVVTETAQRVAEAITGPPRILDLPDRPAGFAQAGCCQETSTHMSQNRQR